MSQPATMTSGWLRSPAFDGLLILGCAALALVGGWLTVLVPALFVAVFYVNLWVLGYHHVIATFTRLVFDKASFREHWFLVTAVPVLILAGTVLLVTQGATVFTWFSGSLPVTGGILLMSVYLYWQWFHYTRQSYGIAQLYSRQSQEASAVDRGLTQGVIYLVPLVGILYRSYQYNHISELTGGFGQFLFNDVWVLPVPWWLVTATGALAAIVFGIWLVRYIRAARTGRATQACGWYMISHVVIFMTGYVLIDDMTKGWLVLNIWHNAQYLLLVWMYNNNRFRAGIDPEVRFLSTLSQSGWQSMGLYFGTCLLITGLVYWGIQALVPLIEPAVSQHISISLVLIVFMALNFHHYVVDGEIWKVRKKQVRSHLGVHS